MPASTNVIPLNLARFTAADEKLMTRLVPQLESLGYAVAREPGEGLDRFVLYSICDYRAPRDGGILPAWAIVRTRHGVYELCDGSGGVLYRGRRLDQVLLPGWLPTQPAA